MSYIGIGSEKRSVYLGDYYLYQTYDSGAGAPVTAVDFADDHDIELQQEALEAVIGGAICSDEGKAKEYSDAQCSCGCRRFIWRSYSGGSHAHHDNGDYGDMYVCEKCGREYYDHLPKRSACKACPLRGKSVAVRRHIHCAVVRSLVPRDCALCIDIVS